MIKLYTPYDRGFTVFPFVFMPRRLRGTENESPYLAHEGVHYWHQSQWGMAAVIAGLMLKIYWLAYAGMIIGPLAWIALYFLSKRFRFHAEVQAYAAEIREHRRLGHIVDMRYFAVIMANDYWGMCTMAEAREALERELS
jgi:hypothetical protein